MLKLKALIPSDFNFVKEVYDHYILNSTATFHTEEIDIEELKEAILTDHPIYKSYVIQEDDVSCGFCYISQYKKRQAYDRTAEVTVYLHPDFHKRGLGTRILKMLEAEALNVNLSVLIGIITGENEASIRLFERCGYEKCAHFKQVGEKFGRVLDVVAYQRILI